MHPIDFVNKVKELFNDAPIATESQVEFVEYTLENGTTINIDKYEVGGVATLADGTFAPMGEHILADKSVIIVDENGVIVEIKTPEVEEEMPEVDAEQELKEKIAKLEEELAATKGQFEAQNAQFAKQEDVVNAMYSKFEAAIKDLASAIEGLATTATADPIETPNTFQKIEKKNEKISRFLEMAKKVK
jgi:hypothetical protein